MLNEVIVENHLSHENETNACQDHFRFLIL